MKKIITKVIFFSVFMFAFISCNKNDNEENIYKGENFISFGTSTSASALESSTNAISITAYASIPNLQNDITVNFEVSLENATSDDFIIVDDKSSFTFGPNKYSDVIKVLPVNNFDEDGEKKITLTLTNSSDGTLIGLPGPDSNSKSFTVTFEDDDCAFSLEQLGSALWAGSDNASGSQGPNASQITTSFDGTNLLIEGIAYGWLTNTAFWDEVVIDSNPVIAQVDPLTGAVTIELQYLCETTWLGNPQPLYSIEATGQYVSCTETMTIDYNLIQNGGILRSFTETITIQ